MAGTDKGRLGMAPLDIPAHTAALFARIASMFQPPPRLTLSQWADAYRVLSMEGSSESGRWHTDKAPYQREVMDAIGDPKVRRVVIMCAAQLGKTEMLLNILGFFMAYRPAPIMVMQPNLDMGQAFSKDRLATMIRDTPALRRLVDVKSRSSGNTIMKKNFPGGHVTIVGSNSPAGLRSRPIKVLLADEVDAYPQSAGTEGDPLSLAQKRQDTFWDKKTIMVSTPGIKGISRIEQEFEHSTREEWNVPCPECGHMQPLAWAKVRFNPKDVSQGVRMACERCGAEPGEHEWKAQAIKGRYVAADPDAGTRGFHLNSLSSPFRSWGDIVESFLLADRMLQQGNPEAMKAWENTELGQPWEEKGSRLYESELMARREGYGAEVPDGVLVLTAGVDTQDDRFEAEVVGWGIGKESWGIRYQRIYGDLKGEKPWRDLDALLLHPFHKADGTVLYIQAAFIDSGGHFTNEVYAFTKARWERRVWALKGKGGADTPYLRNPTKSNRAKTPLFTVGVDTGKALLYQRLRVSSQGYAGFCHFPLDERLGYDEAYFKGLTSEKMVIRFKKGRSVAAWEVIDRGHERNEPLDCRNYAQAAMEALNPPALMDDDERAALEAAMKRQGRRMLNRGIG